MSNVKYTKEFKETIVNLYNSGKSLAELHSEYGVAKSTMKSWIDKTKPVEIDNDTTITKEELQKILKENAKIKEENEILKKAITIFTKN